MTHSRMAEAAINASLDAYLHDAQHGDVNQARCLHDMLDKMLTEQESAEGQLWLTEHGKMLLADMHRQLSHCEESGNALNEHVLDAVRLKPRKGHWPDSCDFVADLRIALSVANELCIQGKSGCETTWTRQRTRSPTVTNTTWTLAGSRISTRKSPRRWVVSRR